MRTLTREELLERLAAVPDQPAPPAAVEVSPRRWALRRAAVLRGFFTLPELTGNYRAESRPSRTRLPDNDEAEFIREDCERVRTPHGGRWRLTAETRRAAMNHIGPHPNLLLGTLAGAFADPLDVGRTMAEAYLRGDVRPLTEQTLDQLSGTRLAAQWLVGVMADLPSLAAIETQVRLTTLFTPLRIVLDTPIRGRESELQQIRQYADRSSEADEEFRPLVISGPGGIGKSTLLAALLLERSGRTPAERVAPFAYLTFDRMDLAPQKPLTVLAEILRQLAIQVPANAVRCTEVARDLEGTQETISAQERDDENRLGGTVDAWRRWERDIDLLLQHFAEVTTEATGGPLLCVMDTFERAQRQGAVPVARLFGVLNKVAQVLTGLRVVVAGRGGVPDSDIVRLDLRGLGDEAGRSVLLDRLGGLAVPRSLVDTVVRRARGNPLTLRLAAELMRRQAGALRSQAARRLFLEAFAQAEVHGVLYQRILDHVDTTEAQLLAIPGMVLRRITLDLVRDVLARSAGLGSITTDEAWRLYQVLRVESSLLIEREGALVHREDVRAQVLPIIERADPALVASVHRRAVRFYSARSDTRDRAEELYHRMALAQKRRTLENRWDDEAGASLHSVLDENLDPRIHAWLATKLGLGVNKEILRQADDADWVSQSAKTARELLDAGRPAAALQVLQGRSLQPLDLRLAALHVEAHARSGQSGQAQELATQAMRVAAERNDTEALLHFRTLAAQLAEDSGDYGHALLLLTEAKSQARLMKDVIREAALGASMLRLLRRQGLAKAGTTLELREDVIQLARALTRKQLTSSPGLVRDLAAEIGVVAPEFVIEASKMFGVDVTSQQALRNLIVHGKEDVADRIREILDTDEAVVALPENWAGHGMSEYTSSAQGGAIGHYLQTTGDVAANHTISEYFQVEADAPSFEEDSAALLEGIRLQHLQESQIGHVTINVDQGARPPWWPVVLGPIPPRVDSFQERAEALARLVGSSAADPTAVLTQPAKVVSGLGGVGKTQLAGAYARQLLDTAAVDMLVWVPAATRAGIVASYARAAELVGLPSGSDPEIACERFIGWLATTDRPWLIVFDDLTLADDLRGLWPPDHRPAGRTLVTTRRRDATLLAGRELIDLDVFTADEARAYLSERLPLALADDTLGVSADLGRLPLALAHAAAFMLDTDLPCTGYRALLADRRRRLDELFPPYEALFDDTTATVATTWSISIEQANWLHPEGLAGAVLELASMLDPNGIPVSVFTTPSALTFLTERTNRALNVGVDEHDVLAGLANLRRFSLITVRGSSVVLVHALVQRAIRDSLSDTDAGPVIQAAADAVLELWPAVERDTALAALLRANAATIADRADAKTLWSTTAGGHPLLARAVRSLGEAGLVISATTAAIQLHQQANRRLGADHPDTLAARGSLAYWRGEAGDAAGAAVAYEQLLADMLRVLGPDHPDTLTTRGSLAHWRGEAGDAAGAAVAYEQLLPDMLRVLGPDHPDTLITRHNLARWRGEAGDPGGAVAAYEQLLADMLRVLGPDHPDTLITRHNLARWRGEAGDPGGAVAAYEQLLADILRVLGPDHPNTLSVRGNLAAWRGEAGDAAGAAVAYEQLLPDMLRVLGPDHPNTLTTRHNLARWRGEAGDPGGAVAAYEQLLPDMLRVLGPDHPNTLITRHNLAYWRGEAGDPGGAVAAYEQLLADMERVLGADHPETLAARGNWPIDGSRQGDPAG
ncbi:FxSxx-COOH system tetratricopeptide repeat protein [Kribbella sp. C-35]|uniref:FxSxx-COOH system tetratricopeptide repeat protein n=1 Tax=Kribbella sp. C-35 TaxID=2789276 RepID=UPI00397E8115